MPVTRLGLVGILTVLAACVEEHECAGGLDLVGTPAAYTIAAGVQPDGYVVEAPVVCADGVTSIVVRGPGAQLLTSETADAFFADVLAALAAEGVTAFGPGMTIAQCGNLNGSGPYLYFLQLRDWAFADATVHVLGLKLGAADLADVVGVEVGLPIMCPM